MIILISGNSHVGKTFLSQKLLERYKIPYLSVDHLKMGLYRGLKEDKYHPETNHRILGETLWPIIKGIITTCIENEQNLIIEGCYLLPHLINDFEDEYLQEITSVFFGFSDDYIRNGLESKILKYRSIIELREEDEQQTVEGEILEHREFKQDCLDHSVKYFEIDNDYEEGINKIIEHVDKQTNYLSNVR